jgi:hypothetical protein
MPNPRTRASTRKSGDPNLVGQARQAAESAVKDLQKRLPPDLVKQIERSLERGQNALDGSLKQVQARLNRTASQTDVDRLTRRIDDLTRQVNRLLGVARGAPSATARRTPSPPRLSSAKPAASRSSSDAKPGSSRSRAPRSSRSGADAGSASKTPGRRSSSSSRRTSNTRTAGEGRSSSSRPRNRRSGGSTPPSEGGGS